MRERAGEKPRFKAVYTDDPAAYVISKNIHRRHLTKQKQADLIVAAIRADADAKAAAGEIAAAALRSSLTAAARRDPASDGGSRRSGPSLPGAALVKLSTGSTVHRPQADGQR